MSTLLVNQLPLAPLGAGDLIDRAVRLYRSHFFTLIRIASPPVVVAAAGSVLWAISWRQFTATSSEVSLAFFFGLAALGLFLMFAGNVFSLIVMGGATRNLVTHLLWNEPVSARATYAAVRSRFWGLLLATLLVMLWLTFVTGVTLVVWYMVIAFVAFGAIMLAMVAPAWLATLIGVVGGLAISVLGLWLFFILAGRVAYIPQAMLVEGKGLLDAIGRSFSLAGGNVKRLMAMALFTSFAFYAALMILIVPLGWFGYLSGVDLSPLNQNEWPAWYTIAYNVILETSHILLAPVWMLGFSLLYVDERVRREGYDIELMAARQLPAMPELGVTSPLAPAISLEPKKAPPPPMATGSVLGLR
jgi:hypothetical protein